MKPEGAEVTPYPETAHDYKVCTGYTCPTCGFWVQLGTSHHCLPNYGAANYWHRVPAEVVRFAGNIAAHEDLPTDAPIGDAYYIEQGSILVVRTVGGWYAFDRVS